MSYEQIIYNRCRKSGMTEAAALAIVGNFYCESNCEPFRVEGDFSPYKTVSKTYVADVTSGKISRDTFSHDARGFGLYQLTFWSRKQGYYDFWKASGKPLDSAELQTDYAIKELKSDFSALWSFLKQTNDVFTATSRICREFERPAVNNIDARYAAAKRFQYELDLDGWDDGEPEPEPTPEPPQVDHSLLLRTIDRNCSGWDETYLLQDILTLRKYDIGNVDGEWNENTQKAVVEFQKDFSLTPDGIVGQKTWNALFQR